MSISKLIIKNQIKKYAGTPRDALMQAGTPRDALMQAGSTKYIAVCKARKKMGYSIAELLIVIAILGVVLSGVTVGVSAAMRQYNSAMRRAQINLLFSTLYDSVSSELRYCTNANISQETGTEGLLTFTSNILNMDGSLECLIVDSEGEPIEGEMPLYLVDEGSLPSLEEDERAMLFFVGKNKDGTVRYQPLLSNAAYHGTMNAFISEPIYNADEGVFEFSMAVNHKKADEELIKQQVGLKVAPVNTVDPAKLTPPAPPAGP